LYITDYNNVSGANTVALEDSIMQKGKPVTAGSKILEHFISPVDAAVVTKLTENNYKIAGKTQMDEFGAFGFSRGCLSGATEAVKSGRAEFAVCNDLFGKYRREAAENNLCYIHPTYGTVSRYGLIPAASSMDTLGICCKDLTSGFGLLSKIAGNDEKDGVMFPEKTYSYSKTDKKLVVAVPENVTERLNDAAQKNIKGFAAKFSSVNITLKYFDLYKQVMYILSSAEISNNTNRYDGIKFGFRAENYKGVNDLYIKTRTQGFGANVKLAAIMGAFVLSQDNYVPYYEKAMKIRRLIKESLRFDEYDIIILPVDISANSGDAENDGDMYENISLFALANLAGLACVSFSYGGQGIMLVSEAKNENALLTAWEVQKNEI
jgi:aspartyl-tRNA(Asn)/glutamyl-tRNA(Gln) amidotransferase subunit A